MPAIMPVETFRNRTSITARLRPDKLKAVDTALDTYNKAPSSEAMRKLYVALNAWIGDVGQNWRQHERNSKYAISNLYDEVYRQMFGGGGATFDAHDKKAIEHWKKMRKQAANALFSGAQLELKSEYARLTRMGLGKLEITLTGNNVRNMVDGSNAIKDLVHHVVRSHVDPGVAGEVIGWLTKSGLINEWIAQAAGSVLPFVGLITSGGGAIYNGIRAAYDTYKASVVDTHRGVLDVGTPQAAAKSLALLIDRDKSAHLTGAAQSLVEFGARAICTAVDPSGMAQGVVGMASAVASITYRIFIIGRDFSERKAANLQLAQADFIDQTIFNTHPLLGCYFIARADAATLISFFGEFGQAGWVADVEEKVATHLTPLRNYAIGYIEDSRFILMRNGVPYWSTGQNSWSITEGRWENMGTGKNKYGAISSENPNRVIYGEG